MKAEFIKRFAFEFFKVPENGIIDEFALNVFIRNRPEVGKFISAEEIKTALSELYMEGKLEAIVLSETYSNYRKAKEWLAEQLTISGISV
jgi:hypothetical protein